MGYIQEEYCVIASLSKHNSNQDIEDEKLWKEVTKRIDEIVNDPKYKQIKLMTGF